MNDTTYELMYGNGGHVGPIAGPLLDAMVEAQRILRGIRSETKIYIVPRNAPTYAWKYAVAIGTKRRDDPTKVDFEIK